MSNPYNNEVIFNGQTLMSLKEDTVTPDKVLAGETFHDRSGAPQTGNLITHDVYDGLDSTSTSDALSANQGRQLNESLTALASKLRNMNVVGNTDSGGNLLFQTKMVNIISVYFPGYICYPFYYNGNTYVKFLNWSTLESAPRISVDGIATVIDS